MKRAAALLLLAVTLLYPFAVYWGLGHMAPRWIALTLFGMVLLRLCLPSRNFMRGAALAGAVLALLAFLDNTVLPLKLYPVAVNGVLLMVFLASLRHPPTVIERLARLREPLLPPHAIAYTRQVTIVWCFFFAGNGALALITALYASERWWALYNGLLAYLLMGALFTGEWLVRQRVRARNASA
jgi:uncharacterized membrane protein